MKKKVNEERERGKEGKCAYYARVVASASGATLREVGLSTSEEVRQRRKSPLELSAGVLKHAHRMGRRRFLVPGKKRVRPRFLTSRIRSFPGVRPSVRSTVAAVTHKFRQRNAKGSSPRRVMGSAREVLPLSLVALLDRSPESPATVRVLKRERRRF